MGREYQGAVNEQNLYLFQRFGCIFLFNLSVKDEKKYVYIISAHSLINMSRDVACAEKMCISFTQ